MNLSEQAQNLADRIGTTCWVVHPRRGTPYVTHRADQITPGYVGIEPHTPRPECRSCWPPSGGVAA